VRPHPAQRAVWGPDEQIELFLLDPVLHVAAGLRAQ
jgi:hypothetical protein